MSQTLPPRPRGRPRKMPQDHAATRSALIQAGMAALTEYGFLGCGLDTILKDTAIPKGSFHSYFESKDAFGLELIHAYAAYFNAKLDHWLLDKTTPPLDRLSHFMKDAKAGMIRHGFRRGCLIGNLFQEVSSIPDSFHVALQDTIKEWERRTAVCLSEISPKHAENWAVFFWIGWEGAVLRARVDRSSAALDVFANGFRRLIQESR